MLSIPMPRDARSLSHQASADLRRTTVRAVLEGATQRAAAKAAGVHEMTVSKWMKAYRAKGERLFLAKEAPGARPKLSGKQIAALRRTVIGKNPDQLSFGPQLWTLPIIGQLVESKFGVVLHATTIMRLLHRIGITPQKPIRQSVRRDARAVERWRTKEFPKIVRRARRRRATLLFVDETGVHEDHAVGTTWAKRGAPPVVKVGGGRRRVNVISALSPSGKLWFRCYAGMLTAQRYADFLRALLADVPGNIELIHDRHPSHCAAAVRRLIQSRSKRLSVHELPPYAPDLNPDEHVWSFLKGRFRRDPLRADEDLAEAADAVMLEIAADRELVKSFFGHPESDYVTAALKNDR